ncbi:D-alanyl-D-alanine carboxypeptidase [Streptomyces sp. NPDC001315]|uniref:D-alanyl-D-alanine carboxypeptidase n=1 Tax=Streptomyces sp. NPDC001315 TaxID=3364562 RepID=UPI0036BF54BB
MEEASVAGESPDRSKQRESSTKPTSGSAGAVPEARGEVRDPRLSVTRESSSGGVDTATKIFSVRELATDAEETTDVSATADASATRGAATDVETTEADAAEETGDEAVAESAEEAGSEDAEGAGASGGDDSSSHGTDVDGDARLRAAVAAWVGSADQKTADGKADEASVADAGAVEDAEGATEGPESPESASKGASEGSEVAASAGEAENADQDADEHAPKADSEPAAATDSGTDSGTGSGTDAESGSGTDARSDSATGSKVDAGTDAKADAETDARAGSGTEAKSDSGTGSKADAETDAKSDSGTDAKAGAGTGPKADAKSDSATPKADPGNDAKSDSEPDSGPPVDQPTAVFKLVRPDKPAVDQPTTMLKLGGAAKPPKAPAKAPATAPESDPERTSKFVALKPLDAPETRKPKPVAPAPADETAAVPQIGPERTTQQPLPPKPPLDLLAELTNTPRPPETALRTTFRRVKIWTPLVILLAIVFAIVQAVRPLPATALTLTAEDSYTFDGAKVDLPWPSEGQGWMDVNGIGSMGDFGKQTPVAIGSVAKAMTAYIVLKDHPLKSGEEGASITVDATAEKEGGYDKDGESTLNTVKEGDKLTEKQALSAVMIPSANNIARLLARWDAGSETAFIKKMNATAKELGMSNTTYTDASGLKETTVSTAEDQVKLGHELVKIQALMDITKLPSWTDPSGQKHRNYNTLVPYNNALGIKTGSTTKAGGNLLFAATKEVGGETVTLVGAVLGQHTAPIIDTVNAVSKTAMLAAQDAMTSAKILKKGDVVGYVDDQLGGRTPVVVAKDVTAVGWAGLKVKLTFDSGDVPHTAKAGTQVGTLTVGDGSGDAVEVPVALQTDLAEPGFTNKLTRLG